MIKVTLYKHKRKKKKEIKIKNGEPLFEKSKTGFVQTLGFK